MADFFYSYIATKLDAVGEYKQAWHEDCKLFDAREMDRETRSCAWKILISQRIVADGETLAPKGERGNKAASSSHHQVISSTPYPLSSSPPRA